MAWIWRLENGDGTRIDGPVAAQETFTTQADAESWLGEHWRELHEAGVAQVSLLEDSDVVYGPMGLGPAA